MASPSLGPVIAAALFACLLAGCAGDDLPAVVLPSPTATAGTSTTSPALTSAESDFVVATGSDLDDEPTELLADGWYVCTGDHNGYEPAGWSSRSISGPPDIEILKAHHDDDFYAAAITHLCPEHLPLLKKAQKLMAGSFDDGTYEVGADIKPGTYRTDGPAEDCYWERSTRGGKTIANDFVTNAPGGVTVMIAGSDGGFKSENCGTWLRVR